VWCGVALSAAFDTSEITGESKGTDKEEEQRRRRQRQEKIN